MRFIKGLLFSGMLFGSVDMAQAVVLYADTNGDGVTDTISTGATTNNISIYHPNTGSTTYYNFSPSLVLTIVSAAHNTDGRPGNEVVLYSTSSAYGQAIQIIDDARGTTRQYRMDPFNSSRISIVSMLDTDGLLGDEIVVSVGTGSGPLGELAIRFIDDARNTIRQHTIGSGLTFFEITSVTDTDGRAGAEVVTRIGNSTGTVMRILDDARSTSRQYPLTTLYFTKYFSILGIRNYDGYAGAEVCYAISESGPTFYQMIVDRIGSVVSRSSC